MFQASFYTQLKQLSQREQSLFCLSLAQRSAPNYLLFSQCCHFGDANKFTNILDITWQKLLDPHFKVNFEQQQDKFEALIPKLSDYDNYGVYPALDSCVLVSAVFDSITGINDNEAIHASKTSLGSVINFIEFQAGSDLSLKEIEKEELYLLEHDFQQQLLSLIKQDAESKAQIKQIKKLAVNEGISNIGISL